MTKRFKITTGERRASWCNCCHGERKAAPSSKGPMLEVELGPERAISQIWRLCRSCAMDISCELQERALSKSHVGTEPNEL